MKPIFEYIEKRSDQFAQHSLFKYLRDDRIDARQRLRFVPNVAHFVMTFADLYHFFLLEEQPRDQFEQLSNKHLSEEATHWKWFLADLTNLDLDPVLSLTDALRFIWSEETKHTRLLAYQICRLSAGLRSMHKLVMVQAIEATGRVALEAAVPAGQEAAARLGRNLVYFGSHHLETERAHTLEEPSLHSALEAIPLDEPTIAELRSIVDRVFAYFEGFVDEAFLITKTTRTLAETVKASVDSAHA